MLLARSEPTSVRIKVGKVSTGSPESAVKLEIYALMYGKTIAGAFAMKSDFLYSSISAFFGYVKVDSVDISM